MGDPPVNVSPLPRTGSADRDKAGIAMSANQVFEDAEASQRVAAVRTSIVDVLPAGEPVQVVQRVLIQNGVDRLRLQGKRKLRMAAVAFSRFAISMDSSYMTSRSQVSPRSQPQVLPRALYYHGLDLCDRRRTHLPDHFSVIRRVSLLSHGRRPEKTRHFTESFFVSLLRETKIARAGVALIVEGFLRVPE